MVFANFYNFKVCAKVGIFIEKTNFLWNNSIFLLIFAIINY